MHPVATYYRRRGTTDGSFMVTGHSPRTLSVGQCSITAAAELPGALAALSGAGFEIVDLDDPGQCAAFAARQREVWAREGRRL